jgi:polar amino acid transport system substrate-binding protein
MPTVANYQICLVSLLRYPDQDLISVITPFTYEPLGIALPAGDSHFINRVKNFLNTLKKSGELDKLRARWIKDGS